MRKVNKKVRILVVDEENRPVGSKRRDKALQRGLNFRTVHVFASSNGTYLLQKLSNDHQRSPGRIGASAAGFVLKDETSILAAARVLDKELGIRPYHLASVGTLPVKHDESTKFVEVFVASIGQQTIASNEAEFSELLPMRTNEIGELLEENAAAFTETFAEVFPMVAGSPMAEIVLDGGEEESESNCDALLEAYKVSVDEYRFQVELSWNRNKFFLISAMAAISAAIAMTEFSSQKYASLLIPFLFLLSTLLAILGLSAQRVGKTYYRQTHNDLLEVISTYNVAEQRRDPGYVPIPTIRTTAGMRHRLQGQSGRIDGRIGRGTFSGYLRWFYRLIAFVGLLGAALSLYFGVYNSEQWRVSERPAISPLPQPEVTPETPSEKESQNDDVLEDRKSPPPR